MARLGTDNPNALAKQGEAKTALTELERSGIGSGVPVAFLVLRVVWARARSSMPHARSWSR